MTAAEERLAAVSFLMRGATAIEDAAAEKCPGDTREAQIGRAVMEAQAQLLRVAAGQISNGEHWAD